MKVFTKFFTILVLSTLNWVSNAGEIELSEPKTTMIFVNEAGKLKKACRGEFLGKTEIHRSVELWDTFKGALNTE